MTFLILFPIFVSDSYLVRGIGFVLIVENKASGPKTARLPFNRVYPTLEI